MLSYPKVLTPQSDNPTILSVEYAVRGKLVLSALELDRTLHETREKGKQNTLPFDDIIYCNIGNPQQLNQKPITFVRQVQ
jgi:alanine transaminase